DVSAAIPGKRLAEMWGSRHGATAALGPGSRRLTNHSTHEPSRSIFWPNWRMLVTPALENYGPSESLVSGSRPDTLTRSSCKAGQCASQLAGAHPSLGCAS